MYNPYTSRSPLCTNTLTKEKQDIAIPQHIEEYDLDYYTRNIEKINSGAQALNNITHCDHSISSEIFQFYLCDTESPFADLIHNEFCSFHHNRFSHGILSGGPFKTNISEISTSFSSNLNEINNTETIKSQITPSKRASKVIRVANLQDDFYLKLLDWSEATGLLAMGIENEVIVWNPSKQDNNDFSIPTDVIQLHQPFEQISDFGNSRDMQVTSVTWDQQFGPSALAVGYRTGSVSIWDVQTGIPIRSYRNHLQRVGSLDWCGPILTSGSRDKTIVSRDIRAPGEKIFCWDGHKQEVCGVSWSPLGCGIEGLLVSGGNDNIVYVWQLGYQHPIHKLRDHSAAVKALAWSPHHAGLLATGGGTNDRCIRFWDINRIDRRSQGTLDNSDKRPLTCSESGSQICNIAWSRTTDQIVTTHGFTLNQIILWDVKREISDDSCDDINITKVDVLEGHTARVLFLALSPEGDTIATAAGDETLRFWKIFTPKNKSDGSGEPESIEYSSNFLAGVL